MIFNIPFNKNIILTVLFLLTAITTVHAANSPSVSTMGGTSSSVGTDPNTGAANVNIPIVVPPGRNGMAPNLALSYNSNKQNGWIGVGWDLKTSFIQRNTKWGVDYTNNDYVADGSRELIARGDWGAYNYGQKIEGAFIKYYYNGSGGWTATTKEGTKHYYGTTASSKQDDPDNSSKVFKWMIDKVEDTNGNYITYTYTKDQGEIYLDKISYTGGTGLSPTNYIKFYYESRTDAPAMFIPNFSVKTAKRLITIEAVSNSNIVRAYKLDYDADPDTDGLQYSASTGRSILNSVRQYGSDASLDASGTITGGTSLAATEMEWTETNNVFDYPAQSLSNTGAPNGNTVSYYYQFAADFNGDGKTDYMWNNSGWYVALSNGSGFDYPTKWLTDTGAPNGNTLNWEHDFVSDFNGDDKADYMWNNAGWWCVALSNGSGFDTPTKWISDSGAPNGNTLNIYYQFVADFNGDGKSDYMWNNSGWYVALSNGSGFDYPTKWLTDTGAPNGNTLNWEHDFVSDFNGDDKADYMWNNAGWWCVALSNGSGFDYPVKWLSNTGAPNGNTLNLDYQFVSDFNGDGKTDYMWNNSGWYVALSNGSRFDYPVKWLSDTGAPNGNTLNWEYNFISDFNGDGKADYMWNNVGWWCVALSNGSGFEYPTKCLSDTGTPNGSTLNTEHQFVADFTGDGKADLMWNNTGWWCVASDITLADRLTTLKNGVGGTTTITYEPSTTYTNTQLPFNVQTVSTITVSDGNGNTSTTNYTYSGGHHDIADREFRGFEYVKSTDPVGTTTETWFKQDDIFKGLPYKTETKDSSGNLYSKTEKTFSSTTPYTGVNFPYLSQSDDFVYDGTGTAKEVSTTFTYDAYGNITEKYFGGDTSVTGDERDEYTEYEYDTTNWIVSLPNHTYVNNDIGSKASEAWFTYDTAGNLLTDTRWNDSGTNPVITYTYNSSGNQISITDPKSNTTTITYDSTNIYPNTATNPLSQTATTVYDAGLGKITSEIDPNGNTTTYTYDVFGRLTKVTGPLDITSTYGTVTYEYQDCGNANLRIITYRTEEHGTANHIRSEVCLDGLERTITTWRDGPDGSTIVADIEYDSSGRVYRKSLPYSDGTQRWITYTYDPVGRVTEITNPDGTTTTTVYDKGTMTYTDANGNKKVEEKDVYGRLITVEEYMDGGLYATSTYEYNTIGNLIKLTDTDGNQTTMTYDTLGRKLTMVDPDMGTWSYAYDANGNLTSQTDSRSRTITFTYDALNRATYKDNPNDPDITYTYDEAFSTNPKGRLTTLTDASGITKYYYDELGMTVKSIKTVDTTDYTTQTTYDALGRTKSLTYPDSETINYTYGTGGNLTGITDGTTTYAAYTGYNALGQTGNITYGNGVTTAYTYETDNNLLSTIVTETSDGTGLLNLSYAYDNTDNITTLTDNIDSSHTQTFTYDSLDRLTQAQSTAYGTLDYAYDEIGNITTKRGVTYTYGGPCPHAVTEISGGANASDRTVVYNDNLKPSSIDYDGETTEFVYSGVWSSKNRAEKIATAATTVYIGGIYEQTGSSSTKYIFAGGTRVAVKTDTETYYYYQDHLGSTRVVTNSSGANVEEIHYYPYGETLSDTGSVSVKHKFTSQELDRETGLYYYGARYYDPVLARFISADPIVPDPTNPQALNRYSYVLNNPLKYIDPNGHGFFSKIKRFVKKAIRAVRKVYSHPVFRIASAVVVAFYTGGMSFAALGREGLLAYGGAAIAGGSVGALTYATSGYDEGGGGGSGSSGIQTDGGTAISANGNSGSYNSSPALGWMQLLNNPAVQRTGQRIASLLSRFGSRAYSWISGWNRAKVLVNPKTIRFTQKSINNEFSNGRTLRSVINDLKVSNISSNDFPPIRVFQRNGQTFTLDNRRLKVFQEAGIRIRTVSATKEEIINEAWKFTTINNGISIHIRKGGL